MAETLIVILNQTDPKGHLCFARTEDNVLRKAIVIGNGAFRGQVFLEESGVRATKIIDCPLCDERKQAPVKI